MELPICWAIVDCGKSLSEMLAEPWTNIAVQPPDSCANQRAYLSRRFRQIPICPRVEDT